MNGAVAGLGGGVVFGLMLGMMGMLPMIASLVGSKNLIVGLIVHLVISAMFGAGYAVLVPSTEVMKLLGFGALAGVVLWVLGKQLIMAVWLGQPVFVMNQTAMMALVGHLVYGLVTATILFGLRRRAQA